MLLYDVIRWWTLGVQAFKCRTAFLGFPFSFSKTFSVRTALEFHWSAESIDVRIFSHLFSINCDWVQDHPWQIKMKNQLIDEMWCYRFPCLETHVPVRQTMVTFFQIRSYLSTHEQKKRNQLTIFLSKWRTAQSPMQAYLVGSKSMDKSGLFERHENENGKNHKNRYLFSIFVFYLVMTLSLTNVHSALRWWYASCDITRTHNVYLYMR